jgi:hypothetical protein
MVTILGVDEAATAGEGGYGLEDVRRRFVRRSVVALTFGT